MRFSFNKIAFFSLSLFTARAAFGEGSPTSAPAAKAAAKPAKAAKAPDGPEYKAALELVHAIVPKDNYQQMIAQMSAQMIAGAQAQGQTLPADAENKIKKVLGEAIPYDEILRWSAEIYAARFSAAELTELTRFYKTPLGQKISRTLPEISGESMRKVAEMLPQRLPELMKKHGLTK